MLHQRAPNAPSLHGGMDSHQPNIGKTTVINGANHAGGCACAGGEEPAIGLDGHIPLEIRLETVRGAERRFEHVVRYLEVCHCQGTDGNHWLMHLMSPLRSWRGATGCREYPNARGLPPEAAAKHERRL